MPGGNSANCGKGFGENYPGKFEDFLFVSF